MLERLTVRRPYSTSHRPVPRLPEYCSTTSFVANPGKYMCKSRQIVTFLSYVLNEIIFIISNENSVIDLGAFQTDENIPIAS